MSRMSREAHHARTVQRLLAMGYDAGPAWALREAISFDEFVQPDLEQERINQMIARFEEQQHDTQTNP
jgi:hypothetical protein